MHGHNEVRELERVDTGVLQVHDVFYTIQGEGPHSGRPAVFVRLTGCNLRCWFCDTTWDDANDKTMTVEELRDKILVVKPPNCNLVVLTGGEPTRQQLRSFFEVMGQAIDIQIETAGTLWQPCLSRPNVEIVVSPKTPQIHSLITAHAIAFKYVISTADKFDEEDGLPMHSTQRNVTHIVPLAKPRAGAPVYLSPMDEGVEWKNTLNRGMVARLAMQFGYRASVQLHKHIGVA